MDMRSCGDSDSHDSGSDHSTSEEVSERRERRGAAEPIQIFDS